MSMQNPFQTIDERLNRLETTLETINEAVINIKSIISNTTGTVTRDKAAEYIGVSVGTMSTLEKSGRLKPIRIGSAIRYSKDQLNEFIESNTK